MRNLIVCMILALLSAVSLWAEPTEESQPGSDLAASLLTCTPGTEAYEVYGHTALRIRSLSSPAEDNVYNYGIFDFNTDYFLWRWLLGHTDYTAAAQTYQSFVAMYESVGRRVIEQPLNLTPDEVVRLAQHLNADAVAAYSKGWTYRYNFFYDNCTTRVIDAIEGCLDEGSKVVWPEAEEQSLRKMLHQFAKPVTPWLSEGQDWLIGTEVDSPATMRQQLFSPMWASHYASMAQIVRPDGSRQALVSGEAASVEPQPAEGFALQPWMVAGLVLAVFMAVLFGLLRVKSRGYWTLISVLHALQGLLGLIITFLFFFSTHPGVDSNWLIASCNPLWFVAAVYAWRCRKREPRLCHKRIYTLAIVAALTAFVVGYLSGQRYPELSVVILFGLLLSLVKTFHAKK